MAEQTAENDELRETLIDFAEWLGQPATVAEWSATRYMEEAGKNCGTDGATRSA